jgi:predicted phosphohydrolase
MESFNVNNLWLASDVHLNPTTYSNVVIDLISSTSKDDAILIAGDICTASKLKYFSGFFKELANSYKYIFYILGNHDYWGSDLILGKEVFKNFFIDIEIKNAFLLDSSTSYIINDHLLVGDTLWTDFDKKDPRSMLIWKIIMNDSVYIKDDIFDYRQISSQRIYEEHCSQIDILKKNIEESNLPVIVCTHHAPSIKSVSDYYYNDPINHYYYTELTEYIMDNPNIKYWLHGHMHNRNSYNIGSTIVACNAYGYSKEIKYKYKLFKVL